MPRLSAIIPVRNRAGTRLRNCLRSLRWQDVEAGDLEIVLSDFGSDPEHAESILGLAGEFDARVVRTEEFDDWNRSRALNIGLQQATSDHVFCTDADMIFEPNFVASILEIHDARPDKALVVCHCHNLPRSVPEQPYDAADFEGLRDRGKRRRTPGTGACQSASKDFFFHVRGYDERYVHWGNEDSDMRDRAIAHGLELVWISEQTSMLHQWHKSSRFTRLVQNRKNSIRYFMTRKQVVKNPERWGNRT